MKCTKCQAPLRPGTNRCPYCGKQARNSAWEDMEEEPGSEGVNPEQSDPGKAQTNAVRTKSSEPRPSSQAKKQPARRPNEKQKGMMPGLVDNHEIQDQTAPYQPKATKTAEKLELVQQPLPSEANAAQSPHQSTFGESPSREAHIPLQQHESIYGDADRNGLDQQENGFDKTPIPKQGKMISMTVEEPKDRPTGSILAGFMAILLAVYMLAESSVYLMGWLGFFHEDLYLKTLLPFIEKYEASVMIIVVWFVAIAARPISMRVLALLFAFASTALYGLFIYLKYFAGAF